MEINDYNWLCFSGIHTILLLPLGLWHRLATCIEAEKLLMALNYTIHLASCSYYGSYSRYVAAFYSVTTLYVLYKLIPVIFFGNVC